MNPVGQIKLFASDQAQQEWIEKQVTAIPDRIMEKLKEYSVEIQTLDNFKFLTRTDKEVLADKYNKINLLDNYEKLDITIQILFYKILEISMRHLNDNRDNPGNSQDSYAIYNSIKSFTQGKVNLKIFLSPFIHQEIMTLPAAKEHYSQRIQSSETWQELQLSDMQTMEKI